MTIWLWAILALVALVVIIFIYYFNKIVVLENRIDNSLSQIDVQLKRRAELVPNLISTVKGYAKHESKIMKEVTDARKALVSATNIQSKVKAGAELQNALKSIFAIAENYPQLKANENFLNLQQELAAIEDKIAYSRQFYNDSILSFNNSVETFPGLIVAKLLNFRREAFYELKDALERETVDAKF